MRIGVDTNVLVRYLVLDDEIQAKLASDAIDGAESIFVSTIVLCETVWVLRRAYRYTHQEIAGIVSRLVKSRRIELDRPAAEAGLDMLRNGGDFADGVIGSEATRERCEQLVTFDRNVARLAGSSGATLLRAAKPRV